MSKKDGRVVTVYLSDIEYSRLVSTCLEQEVSVTEFVKQALLRELKTNINRHQPKENVIVNDTRPYIWTEQFETD